MIVLRDAQSVLSMAQSLESDLFVIGGAQVYQSFLPYIEKWIVTEVPLTVAGADAFVPENYLAGFELTESRKIDDGLTVSFHTRKSVS